MQFARPRPITWLASVLLLGACGSDGSDGTGSEERRVSAKSYVTDVCGAFTTWRNEVVSLSEDLQSSQEPSSIEVAKNSAVSFFADVVGATDRMVSDVEGAGVPDVARGDAGRPGGALGSPGGSGDPGRRSRARGSALER